MKRWVDVAALGVSQIIGYGTLYYSFSVLAPSMARDLGWTSERVFGALSIALLTSGLVAPWTGRWIDRFGAGRIMAFGSAAAALALVACAATGSVTTFVPALVASQVAATLVQYGAAFSLLVQRQPETAQRNIVYLTLIAGFASTIFWPLTAWMHGFLGWRDVYLVFAGLQLVVCLPIHVLLARKPDLSTANSERPGHPAATSPQDHLRDRDRTAGFVMMTTAFALQSFISSAVLIHMLPMLAALGLGAAGVAAGTLFGPAQVASRLLNMVFAKNLLQLHLAIISAVLLVLALTVIIVAPPSFWVAMLFATLFGLGSGLFSIVGGTLPLELFGHQGYGALQGRVMSVRLIVSAAAPFTFALLMHNAGVTWALLASAGIGAGAIVAFLIILKLNRRAALLERHQPTSEATT